MRTQPIGCSESPVDVLSMPASAIRPPMIATTSSDPRADSTGNQARVLSDLRTAHERLAISHEVWNRLIGLQYRSRDGAGVVRTPPHRPARPSACGLVDVAPHRGPPLREGSRAFERIRMLAMGPERLPPVPHGFGRRNVE